MTKYSSETILGGILAGGLSRRMGGQEKSFLQLDCRPLISHAIDRLAPQVATLVINANGDASRFAATGVDIVPDIIEGFAGPLAGIDALLQHAIQKDAAITHVATIAADTPFFPLDFVARCVVEANLQDTNAIIMAGSNTHRHPVFGLWPVALASSLSGFLGTAQTRKVMAFVEMHPHIQVDFAFTSTNDPFFNINTPEDLAMANSILSTIKQSA